MMIDSDGRRTAARTGAFLRTVLAFIIFTTVAGCGDEEPPRLIRERMYEISGTITDSATGAPLSHTLVFERPFGSGDSVLVDMSDSLGSYDFLNYGSRPRGHVTFVQSGYRTRRYNPLTDSDSVGAYHYSLNPRLSRSEALATREMSSGARTP